MSCTRITVSRRFPQPALAVATNPGRIRKLAQTVERLLRPWARRAVVAAEQPAVDAGPPGVRQHRVERGDVAVDVVQKPKQASIVSST